MNDNFFPVRLVVGQLTLDQLTVVRLHAGELNYGAFVYRKGQLILIQQGWFQLPYAPPNLFSYHARIIHFRIYKADWSLNVEKHSGQERELQQFLGWYTSKDGVRFSKLTFHK